jgi:hypothetical protein
MNQMKEMKELETHLHTWALRRPSARLKQRIFASPAAVVESSAPPAFRLTWLAPATAACLMMCVLFNQHNSASLAVGGSSGPLVALILSNQSSAAYLPGSFERQHNSFAAETFESTNGSISTSSISPLPSLRGKINQ